MGFVNKLTGNLKKNRKLYLPAMAGWCLSLSHEKQALMISAALLLALAAVFFLCEIKRAPIRHAFVKRLVYAGACCLGAFAFYTFYVTWVPTAKVAALAGLLHVPVQLLVGAIGLAGCLVGWRVFLLPVEWVTHIVCEWIGNRLIVREKENIWANIKRNWLFVVSSIAFFCLGVGSEMSYLTGIPVAVLMWLVIVSQVDLWGQYIRPAGWIRNALAALSAAGICLNGWDVFYVQLAWRWKTKQEIIGAALQIDAATLDIMIPVLAVLALPFAHAFTLFVWKELWKIIKKTQLLRDLGCKEVCLYAVLLFAVLAYGAFALLNSQAFYGTEFNCDVIYTGDSPVLIKENTYLSLAHIENDLRQPLFAVFSAPFMGGAYFLGRVFSQSAAVRAVLLNSVQIGMLFFAHFALARMLGLTGWKRAGFIALICLTYTQLLFTVMMEQYIIAYFWLILFLYAGCQEGKTNKMLLWATGGTLLTSVTALLCLEGNPLKDFRSWLTRMVSYGVEFLLCMVALCRLDVILGVFTKVNTLTQYAGEGVTWMGKLYQYTAFVKSCIWAPSARIDHYAFTDHVSWQMAQAAGVEWAGVAVLCLAALSVFLNRKKKVSLIAGGWILFSFVMLFGMGWGTQENGLILYSLYFGWAIFALLFQLAQWLADRLQSRMVLPLFCAAAAVSMIWVNFPAIAELIRFAVEYHPVL